MIGRRLVFFLFVSAFLYFFIGGIFSYYLINSFEFKHVDLTYSIDSWATAGYCLAALVLFILAYFTVSKIRFSFSENMQNREHVAGSIELVSVFIVFLIGAFGFVLLMVEYGGQIPAFSEGADEFRTQISSGLPQLLYFQLVSAVLISYALMERTNSQVNKRALCVIIMTGLGLIFLGSSRSMFLTPIIVIGLDLWRRKKIGGINMAAGVLLCGLVAFVVGLFRMGSSDQQGMYMLRFIVDFAPEYREFGKLLAYVPEQSPYLNGQMFINAILIIFPGKILAIFGMSKAQYWQPFGMYIKDLFNYQFAGGGLRAGLIAEFYANFGAIGILGGFFGLGTAAAWLDRRIGLSGDVARMFFLIAGFSVATSVLFTFDAVIYKLFSLGLGWVVFMVFTSTFKTLARK